MSWAEDDKPVPARLTLEIERHVDTVLREHEATEGLPRFETSIEVEGKEPQVLFERFLRDVDLEYGPTFPSGPTAAGSYDYRPRPPKKPNFLPFFQWLYRRSQKDLPPRYFVYRISGPAGVYATIRESRLPLGSLGPGVFFELVGAFPDREAALEEYARVEQEAAAPKP